MNILKHERVRRAVLVCAAPVILLTALLYAVFAPPRFPMGNGYLFSCADREKNVSTILDPGGKQLLGPAEIRLGGTYPWVYGTSSDPACAKFILNLEEHTFRKFPAERGDFHNYDDFDRFLNEHAFTLDTLASWNELYPETATKESDARRRRLKDSLSKRGER